MAWPWNNTSLVHGDAILICVDHRGHVRVNDDDPEHRGTFIDWKKNKNYVGLPCETLGCVLQTSGSKGFSICMCIYIYIYTHV